MEEEEEVPEWVSEFFDKVITTPKEKQIKKRLIEHNEEMKEVYAEIEGKMKKAASCKMGTIERSMVGIWPYDYAHEILGAIIYGAMYYNGDAAREVREQRRTLNDLRKTIIRSTKNLIKLFTEVERIQEGGRMSSNANRDVFDLIDRAGRENLQFRSFIAPIISQTNRFDSPRYYPDFKEVLEALIQEFKENAPGPCGLGSAVFNYRKTSTADFIRFFRRHEIILQNLYKKEMSNLSDKSLAIIANCALDLSKDNNLSIDEDYIKKVKRKGRIRGKKK